MVGVSLHIYLCVCACGCVLIIICRIFVYIYNVLYQPLARLLIIKKYGGIAYVWWRITNKTKQTTAHQPKGKWKERINGRHGLMWHAIAISNSHTISSIKYLMGSMVFFIIDATDTTTWDGCYCSRNWNPLIEKCDNSSRCFIVSCFIRFNFIIIKTKFSL